MSQLPTVEIDGKRFAMVEFETPFVQGQADPILISRREVRGTIEALEKRISRNHPKSRQYREKLAAYKELLRND